MIRFTITTILFWMFLLNPVFAVLPDEKLADPVLESRARAISQHLRCVVCQNENIDESNAGIARDLRVLVRERLQAGDTDDQVLEFITGRYGDFVLLKPRINENTMALWILPFAAFVIGGFVVWRHVRKNGGPERV
jgi:cytochrome c-type biogenesis protein CcmH